MPASPSSHRSNARRRSQLEWLFSFSLVAVVALACRCRSQPVEPPAESSGEVIGVYDSRAIAVAWVGSANFQQIMASTRKEFDAAKAAGDQKRADDLSSGMVALQHRLHLQGFSTAPVDDVLGHVADQLPEIRRQSGASLLVSKWDEATLAQHAKAKRVDVTTRLVDAFHPDDRQRRSALDVQRTPPIPLAEAERLSDRD